MSAFLEISGAVFWVAVLYAIGASVHDYQMSGTWWWKRGAP